MSGSDHRIGSKKAGLSGLFHACVVALLFGFSAPAMAAPLAIEVIDVAPVMDERIKQPVIAIKMASDSAQRFAELTTQNIGRKLELRIDGKTVMAPVIREPIIAGSMQISGGWTPREAKDLADSIAAGKSKVEAELASE